MKRAVLLSIGLVLLMGCGAKRGTGGSATGKITYKGQPVNRATLFFHPTSGEGRDIGVTSSDDGTFGAGDIPPGEYKIYVEAARLPEAVTKGPQIPKGMDPAKAEEMRKKLGQVGGQVAATIPFPNKYKKLGTTDLKCTITEGKQEKLELEMKD
jgi:hypothetical protein